MASTSVAAAAAPAAAPSTAAAAPKAAAGPTEKVVVPVPIMGESITQGILARWNVSVGQYVNADQVVAVLETDKVDYSLFFCLMQCQRPREF